MLFSYIFLFVSLANILHDFHVSSCDVCTDAPIFTPSRLVVKFHDATSANCSICRNCTSETQGLEKAVGTSTENRKIITWLVNNMTEWDTSAKCHYMDEHTGEQCCSTLPVTVYQPPDDVSISIDNHTGPMFEGHQYTLQCTVKNVAPVENLNVTFYRGETVLGQLQSNSNREKKPVTEIFNLNINTSKEDDGAQYRCEAKLELGPEGPQPPPVVTSQEVTATVHYKPQLKESPRKDTVVVTEGDALQLNCLAVGNPSPSYTWTFPSGSQSASTNSTLFIKSTTLSDKGQYTCSVFNSVGNITERFNVHIEEKVIIYIILGIILGLVLAVIVVVILYRSYYRHNRMGKYNMKDVFRLHRQHSAVPTVP